MFPQEMSKTINIPTKITAEIESTKIRRTMETTIRNRIIALSKDCVIDRGAKGEERRNKIKTIRSIHKT